MRIAIGADHAGLALKEFLRESLERAGHEVRDFGTDSAESTDYPDFAEAVAYDVADGKVERGVLVCFTGAGMAIAANKIPGVRATLGWNLEGVRLTRAHNDANVLAIGATFTPPEQALEFVEKFLATPFEGGERHERRLRKIAEMEKTK